MSPNSSEPRYRRRTRGRADHDEAPPQHAPEHADEQQAENAQQQFVEHTALGTRAAGAGSPDGQASAIAPADPAARATLLAGMQQQYGNQHVQRVVQRLRVQRDLGKKPDTKDDPGAKTDTPKLIDAIAAKYPHLAKVLTPEQIAQWQKLIDAATAWKGVEQQRVEASRNLLFDANGGIGGASADVDRYHALERKAGKQAAVANENRYLDVPTELLLASDVLDPGLKGGKEEAPIFAFHTRLYNRLVSVPTRVWLGGEVTSVEEFQRSLWPVHIKHSIFEAELGSDGGQIHWQQLMRASQGLALDYQQVLLRAQAQVTGQMMDIASAPAAYAATDQMREDIFKIRRILGYMHVSDSDESDMLDIVRKWSEADAKADDATKHGMAAQYNRRSDTPLYDEFIGMLHTMTYEYSSIGTAWVGQVTTIYDGLWEEMEGSHYQQLADLLNRSKLWGGRAGRATPKMESVWSYVGKREALGGLGIVNALGRGLTGLVDLGLWIGYKGAGGQGDAPSITPWLAKQQEKEANALAGALGVDLTKETTAFGMDPYHFAVTFGMIPAGLMTAGAMAPLGEAGALITGAQTLQAVDSLVDKIKKMRQAGKSWAEIAQDPATWVQVVSVVAGAIGTAGSLHEAGTATRVLFDQMGTAVNVGKMELVAAAYYALDDDDSIPATEKGQKKAELLADFLQTGAMTIDMRYGEAFKQRWTARAAEGKVQTDPNQPAPDEATTGAGGGPKGDEGTAAPNAGKRGTTQDEATTTKGGEPSNTESKTGGQGYKGKRPPPLPLNKKGFNRPVGEPLHSEIQGRAIMRRLADGDSSALSDIGLKLPENYNPIGREWGLGRTKDGKFVIIEGGTGGVDWEQLLGQGIAPLSHSHPLFKGREMTNPGVTVLELINGTNIIDKVHVMPSVEDVMVCARNGLKWHEVQVPYSHQGDGRIGNLSGNEPGLSIIIHDAQAMGESPDYFFYKSQMEFVAGGQTIWKGEVWAWSNFTRGVGHFSTEMPEAIKSAAPVAPDTAPVAGPSGTTTKAATVPPGTVTLGKKMSSSGNAGSLASLGPEFGVFEGTIAGVPHPVAIKVYPKNMQSKFNEEAEYAEVASHSPQAAKFYGVVDVGPGKLGFAMEKVAGGFPQNESLEPKTSAAYAKAGAEADFYAARITQQTIRDVVEYGRHLLDQGYYVYGDLQGLVDAQGRWKAIDFQGLHRLPADPNSQVYQDALAKIPARDRARVDAEWKKAFDKAHQDHDKNVQGQIDELNRAYKRVQGGTTP